MRDHIPPDQKGGEPSDPAAAGSAIPRRKFLGTSFLAAGGLALRGPSPAEPAPELEPPQPPPADAPVTTEGGVQDGAFFDTVVVGSGFGATMTALSLAHALKAKPEPRPTILMLERGVWWTTPVETVQDKTVATARFLRRKAQPVEYWTTAEDIRGLHDILHRCLRLPGRETGLYDLSRVGPSDDDGVTVARACGVGGGSLVYANVTIEPPDFIFSGERWNWMSWPDRKQYFETARSAIGSGVVFARLERDRTGDWQHPDATGRIFDYDMSARTVTLEHREVTVDAATGTERPRRTVHPLASGVDLPDAAKKLDRGVDVWVTFDGTGAVKDLANNLGEQRYSGLSRIRTRSARLDPFLRGDPNHATWIDRARIFQREMRALTKDVGTVMSSIADVNPEPTPLDPFGAPRNYCERQGRCILGCLPGARHSLNKQLMRAAVGNFDNAAPDDPLRDRDPEFKHLKIEPLAEVSHVTALTGGGYEVTFLRRSSSNRERARSVRVRAKRVILAAGTLGTTEILLRSRRRAQETAGSPVREGLANLSPKLGYGFSVNGDYLAFLDDTFQHTNERVSLTRGPVTTSFAHFNTPEANPGGAADTAKFHTIEDNGLPRVFATVVGNGVELLQRLASGSSPLDAVGSALQIVGRLIRETLGSGGRPQNADERIGRMMCIAAMGRDRANGQFRLARDGRLVLQPREDGLKFHQDPIFAEIRASLHRFAQRLDPPRGRDFVHPTVPERGRKAIASSHPLGGCIMGRDSAHGVVNEFGQVYFHPAPGQAPSAPVYPDLYVADGSMIPSALGVNPSLTISALALRVADHIIRSL